MILASAKEPFLKNTAKWLVLCAAVGLLSGLASAFFLLALQWVSSFRDEHLWMLWLLPFGGLLVGLLYFYHGKDVGKGNNLLLEEYAHPKNRIPFKMAPIVLISTLLTHLFGGSAGREGTAVQMGSAIADQFSRWFSINKDERKTLLIIGISAGFASVFGTPLAGALFALEVLFFSKIKYTSIIPSFLTAYCAYFTVELLQVKHTLYAIPSVPAISIGSLGWVVLAGILFGLTALLFSKTTRFFGTVFSKYISFAPLRPFIGGLVLAIAFYWIGNTKFVGLGIPTIVDAFQHKSDTFDFALKLLFTGFTLGAGFKGGEVTPLFFIGATLGSALSIWIPLPIALLAGIGFVAVFSGATHTPIACTVMAIELFRTECGWYAGMACFVAYLCSGSIGIYSAQKVKGPKYLLNKTLFKKEFQNL